MSQSGWRRPTTERTCERGRHGYMIVHHSICTVLDSGSPTSSQISQWLQLILSWLLISARSSHFRHPSVYNPLLSNIPPKWLLYMYMYIQQCTLNFLPWIWHTHRNPAPHRGDWDVTAVHPEGRNMNIHVGLKHRILYWSFFISHEKDEGSPGRQLDLETHLADVPIDPSQGEMTNWNNGKISLQDQVVYQEKLHPFHVYRSNWKPKSLHKVLTQSVMEKRLGRLSRRKRMSWELR